MRRFENLNLHEVESICRKRRSANAFALGLASFAGYHSGGRAARLVPVGQPGTTTRFAGFYPVAVGVAVGEYLCAI